MARAAPSDSDSANSLCSPKAWKLAFSLKNAKNSVLTLGKRIVLLNRETAANWFNAFFGFAVG